MTYSCPPAVTGVAYPFYYFFKNFLKNSVSLGEGEIWSATPVTPFLFLKPGQQYAIFCISVSMNDYVYQIQGALQNSRGQFLGLRILVCDLYNLDMVDVPVEVLDSETAKYIQFRLSITAEAISITKMPIVIQNKIRTPLGRWLDRWVLDNFYGDNRKHKDINA